MTNYKTKQIEPVRAQNIEKLKQKAIDKLFNNRNVIIQPKYDGERMLIHINGDEVYATSRRISVKTNRYNELQDKLPKFQQLAALDGVGYTVLDCEVYGKDWNELATVTKSLPERAIELQANGINIKLAVFDCLYIDDKDIREYPYIDRYELAKEVVDMLSDHSSGLDFIHMVDNTDVYGMPGVEEEMQKALDNGFEGIMIKPLDAPYDKTGLFKMKKHETVDAIVYDYIQGTGKYSNTIGALRVGYYVDFDEYMRLPVFEHITDVNVGTDADRDNWRDNWESMIYSVVELKCQEITKSSLRHPVIIRIRDDKDYTMCTKETIFKDEA